jgi:hypothetical protein
MLFKNFAAAATYTAGATVQALNGAVNAAAPFNGSFVFNGTTDYAANVNAGYAGDNSFSYLTKNGDTATSGSFLVTQQLLNSLVSINLFFNSQVSAGTSLSAFLLPNVANAVPLLLVTDNIAAYGGVNSGNFKNSLLANTSYSIRWVFNDPNNTGGVAGFNNAVLQAVPEPSEALGLLGFGFAVYGGALQKKRAQKRAA